MKHLLKNTFCTISTVSILSLLFLSAPVSAAAGKASTCSGVQVHRVGAPGKGVIHYQYKDCGQAEFSAFERSTADSLKTAVGEREIMTGKPAYNRRPVNK